jgi:hypothetical protein
MSPAVVLVLKLGQRVDSGGLNTWIRGSEIALSHAMRVFESIE